MEPKPEQEPPRGTTDADRVIREYYESGPPSDTEAFPAPLEMVASSVQRAGKAEGSDDDSAALSGGDPDASRQGIDAGTETPAGSNPTPDQDLVDEIGKAAGVTYQDNEPLDFEEKAARRDQGRWELHPASSEDFQERQTELEAPATDASDTVQGEERRS